MASLAYYLCQTFAPLSSPISLCTSQIASIRIRGAVAVRCTPNLFWKCGDAPDNTVNPRLILVGKPPPNSPTILARWKSFIEHAGSSGARVVIDYTDHWLGDPLKGPIWDFYHCVFRFADVVVVPSTAMRLRLLASLPGFAKPLEVIEDPCEVYPPLPAALPERAGYSSPIGLWFGHPSNFEYLHRLLVDGEVFFDGCRLALVSSSEFLESLGVRQGDWIEGPNGISVTGVAWSTNNLRAVAHHCHYAVIPANPNDPVKSGASSNRLVTSLCLRLPTMASKLESYKEFGRYFYDLDNTNLCKELIKEGYTADQTALTFQATYASRFSLETLEKRWLEVLEDIVTFKY